MKTKVQTLLFILLLALAVVYIVNITVTATLFNAITQKVELARPANLHLTILTDTACLDCASPQPVVAALKNTTTIKIIREETVDIALPAGRQLVQQFGIARIPTVIVTGEVSRPNIQSLWEQGWKKTAAGVYYEDVLPPYVETATGATVGVVNLTIINEPSCTKCFSFSQTIQFFEQAGVALAGQQVLSPTDPAAQPFSAFNITRLPVLLASSNLKLYPQLAALLVQLDIPEKDSTLIFPPLAPPYYDRITNHTVGVIDVTYLSDSSCTTCYNVSINRQILAQFGVSIGAEQTLDVSSTAAKLLIQKYNITIVPTIILSAEAREYPALMQVWPSVGSVEPDGVLVMRDPSQIGPTKNLTTS